MAFAPETNVYSVRLCCGTGGKPYIFPADSSPDGIIGHRRLTRQVNVLDLAIALDTTQSMGPYLDKAREIIKLLGKEISEQFKKLDLIKDGEDAECRIAVSPNCLLNVAIVFRV